MISLLTCISTQVSESLEGMREYNVSGEIKQTHLNSVLCDYQFDDDGDIKTNASSTWLWIS